MENQGCKFFQGFRRLRTVLESHYLAGLNPFFGSFHIPCVRTRFLTVQERQRQQEVDQVKSEAVQLRHKLNSSQRRGRALKFGRNISLFVIRIGVEELSLKIKKQDKVNKELKDDGTKHASEVIKMCSKIHKLEIDMHNIQQQLIKVTKERNEIFSVLQVEKKKSEATESHRTIAISSLRSRFQSEQKKMEDEVKGLQKEIHRQKRLINEMESQAHEFLQDIDKLERTVLRLEQDEMVSYVSQRLSGVLSDISAVALVRPANLLTVEDKVVDIRDCIRDMVKEIQRRRRNDNELREKVYHLEEEREFWISDENPYVEEIKWLQRSLLAANQEIAILRNGQLGNGATHGSNGYGIGVPPGFHSWGSAATQEVGVLPAFRPQGSRGSPGSSSQGIGVPPGFPSLRG